MPNVSLTPEQQTEIAVVVENINTYKEEMMAKFIVCLESLNKFEEFKLQLAACGADKHIEYQQVYDRFMAR